MNKQSINTIDQNKMQKFMNKIVNDVAGTSTAMLVIIGERLGLYTTMMEANGPVSVKELASMTGTVERLLKEWLANQVASGYIEYDPVNSKYLLPLEHALALSDERVQYIYKVFLKLSNHTLRMKRNS